MRFQIRPYRIPDDFGRIAEIFSAINPEPLSAEQFIEAEAHRPANVVAKRIVAVDENDHVIGYAGVERYAWMNPGRFSLWCRMDPAYRKQGVGTAMLEHLEDWSLANGVSELRVNVRDNMPEAIAFAEKHGYTKDRHLFESTLDVPSFDESRFAGAIERAEASGIRFTSLAEHPTEAMERKVYESVRRSVVDIPGNDEESFPPFEEWRQDDLGDDSVYRDCFMIAMAGEAVAGVSYMAHVKETNAMWTFYTGVHPDFRGRGVALALKLLCVRKAKEYGAVYMRTNNDSKNGPMLAVNQKMGYAPCPGQYRMRKRFGV